VLYFLRSAVYFLWVILWTIFCSFLTTAGLLIPPRGEVSQWVVRKLWVRVTLWFCGVKVIASGLENLVKGQPYILMSNHQSHVDIMVIFASNRVNLRFVAKHTLFYIPFFGWYLWVAGYVPINRANRESAIRSLDLAAEKIRKGISVVTFPEGTRSLDGQVQPFKKGPFMLALKAGVPVVPVCIVGSSRVLSKGSVAVHPGRIRVHYGKPVDLTGYSVDDRDRLMAEVHDRIVEGQRIIQGDTNDQEAKA
jgi:1-acyl-sn-glycerol-3-phosphate acyltransferase